MYFGGYSKICVLHITIFNRGDTYHVETPENLGWLITLLAVLEQETVLLYEVKTSPM
jgi:hypothetical protein